MMMKWNIKLVTENKTDEMTTQHLLPTRMCFNFFSHRTNILKFYCQPTFGTFAFAANTHVNNKAKSKEPISPTLFLIACTEQKHYRNKLYFLRGRIE